MQAVNFLLVFFTQSVNFSHRSQARKELVSGEHDKKPQEFSEGSTVHYGCERKTLRSAHAKQIDRHDRRLSLSTSISSEGKPKEGVAAARYAPSSPSSSAVLRCARFSVDKRARGANERGNDQDADDTCLRLRMWRGV